MIRAALDVTGRLETIGHENVKDRAWSYITLGYGHPELVAGILLSPAS